MASSVGDSAPSSGEGVSRERVEVDAEEVVVSAMGGRSITVDATSQGHADLGQAIIAATATTVAATTTDVHASVVSADADVDLISLEAQKVEQSVLDAVFSEGGSSISTGEKKASASFQEFLIMGLERDPEDVSIADSSDFLEKLSSDLDKMEALLSVDSSVLDGEKGAPKKQFLESVRSTRDLFTSYMEDLNSYRSDLHAGKEPSVSLESLASKREALSQSVDNFESSRLALFYTKPAPASDSERGSLLDARDKLLTAMKKEPRDLEDIENRLNSFNEELASNVHNLTNNERGSVWGLLEPLKKEVGSDTLNSLAEKTLEMFRAPFDPFEGLSDEFSAAFKCLGSQFSNLNALDGLPNLPKSPKEYGAIKRDAQILLQYSFSNSSLNSRLRKSKSADVPPSTKAFLARYSHMTKKYDEYVKVFEKFQKIESALTEGRELADSEKISPSEARLISGFGKLVPYLESMDKMGVRTTESHQILKMARVFEEKIKEISHQGWDQATVVMYHGQEELDYATGGGSMYPLEVKATKIATGGTEAHGAVVYGDAEGLRLSHVVGNYWNKELEGTAQSYANAYTVNIPALMSEDAIAKAKLVYGKEGWEDAIKAIWQEESAGLQEAENQRIAGEKKAGGKGIVNSFKRRIKAALPGHKKSSASNYSEELSIPARKSTQICSEYAARSVVVTTNRFNLALIKHMNTKIVEDGLDLELFTDVDRVARFPISDSEKMSRINPAYLIKKWGRPSTKPKGDPLAHDTIFQRVPPGDYAKYFHVPE